MRPPTFDSKSRNMGGRFLPLLAGVLPLVLGPGCSASINEYLLVARKGDVDDVRAAIVGIGEELYERQQAGYRFSVGEVQAVEYLKDVALAHPDPISRMSALSALARLEDVGAERIFLETVDDEHFGVRWEAAKALVRHPVPEASALLAERLAEEPKPEVRVDLIKALKAIGDRVALKALLEAFLAPPPKFEYDKLKAYDGVREISGLEYPIVDRDAWRAYYEKEFPEGLIPDLPEGELPGGPPAGRAEESEPGDGSP